jgi:acylphosphatase
MKNPVITRRVVVHGRVQNVSYREWAEDNAREHGISGFVRNRGDGSVELLLAGPTRSVSAMIEACRRGPPLARVERLVSKPAETPTRPGFHRLPDA